MSPTPTTDELEITILGRGVGECVVVHMLDGNWIIVDSFSDRGRPAARRYLDDLGVSRDQVRSIVVTHVHRDHYLGINALHSYYRSSRLCITSATNSKTFRSLLSDEEQPNRLGGLPVALARAFNRRIGQRKYTPGLRYMQPGKHAFHKINRASLTAVAPTEFAVNLAVDGLAEAIASGHPENVREGLRNANHSSVVLLGRAGKVNFLLCGDLEASPAHLGWAAILDEPDNEDLPKSSLVKAPHHGGASGFDGDMWTSLAEEEPVVLVAPFWPQGLPTLNDLEALCGVSGSLFQAAPSSGVVGNGVKRARDVGRVTMRRHLGEDAWRVVEVVAPAWEHDLAAPTLERVEHLHGPS